MEIRSCRGRWFAATATGVLVTASGFAAQPPAGPWAQAVPLPTACYASQDQFTERNATALETVSAEAASRKAANDQITQDLKSMSKEDPMALAARLQEQMMKDPQAAAKLMQQAGAAEPEAVTAEGLQRNDKTLYWNAEEKDLLKRYEAAIKASLVPARTDFAALLKKLGIDEEWWSLGETARPDWAYAEFDRIKREADQGYAAICPQWWGATGAMPVFMKRFKDYLVSERIPNDEKADARAVAALALQGAATESYKSTAGLDAVRDYMQLAGRLYAARESEPRCTGSSCRDMTRGP